MSGRFTIGRLSEATGTKVQTIRYYEEIGLLPPAPRTEGNQRLYDDTARRRLAFIRHARQLGFPVEAVRELLDLADHPDRPCVNADAIARRQLEEIDHRMVRLSALRKELARMLEQCEGGQITDCRVIEIVSDHSLCLTPDHQPSI